MLGFEEDVFECFEFFVIPNQVEIGLKWLLLNDAPEVVMQALKMANKTVNEVLNSMLRLVDSIHFFFRVVLRVRLRLVWIWDRLKPNVDNGNCKVNREV